MNNEAKTAGGIAQWVIDNRYPRSENDKVSDFELYNGLVGKIDAHTAALRQEVEELRAWKESASAVMNEIDLQSLGKKLGIGLGESVSTNIGTKVDELIERVKDAERLSGANKSFTGWLYSKIEYLESIKRTNYGDGSLEALKNVKQRLEAIK